MSLSVIIVTYGRRKDCRETIKSVLRGRVLPEEVIVVDDHPSIIFAYNNSSPTVRIVHTLREIGVSACRNLAVKLSKGDIIAFLDDDVIVDENWAYEMLNCFRENPEVSVVFGKIKPLYLSTPPKWWNEEIFNWIISVNMAAGANFAVRKDIFEKIGYFREELGIIKGKRFNLEDFEFRERVKKVSKIFFCEKSVVYHKVPSHRLSRRYVLKRCFSEGRGRRILGTYTSRDAVRGICYSIVRFPRFHALCNLVLWLGYFLG